MNSAVPEIVFALIFVVAFGLGTLPGVLALAVHGTGALATLYSEVVESIDAKLRLAVIGPMSIPL